MVPLGIDCGVAMPSTQHITDTDITSGATATFRRYGDGERAVVFVHGFLDDQYVRDKVIAELKAPGFESVQLDLAGCGDRAGASGPFTYERFRRCGSGACAGTTCARQR